MSKYEILCNNGNSVFNMPTMADQCAMMALSHPDVYAVKVVKRRKTNPQGGIGIKFFDIPVVIGGDFQYEEEWSEEYTIFKR